MSPIETVFSALTAVSMAVAVVGCNQQTASGVATADDLNQVARTVARHEDRIGVADLANRLIQDRDQLVVVDLREEAAFDAGHIEGARQMSITEMLSAEGQADLPANRPLVLYAQDSAGAAQGAALLRLVGREAHFLDGGYQAWQQHMAGATGTPADPDEARAMAKQQAVACYFAGDYVRAAGLSVKVSEKAGFEPPVEPVESAAQPQETDPLGLGLGLGMGSEVGAAEEPAAEQADPLGLGLGLGLGPDTPAEEGAAAAPAKLLIGEGC
jgi:thiosulfate sulfurtransferase